MFGARFFGKRYFGNHYWGEGGYIAFISVVIAAYNASLDVAPYVAEVDVEPVG